MVTNGVKSANQVQFQTQNGEPAVPVIGANGGVMVEMADGNTPTANKPTTLSANIITVGTENSDVPVNAEVSEISIANYSESADVTVAVAGKTFIIGSSISVDLLINKTVDNISIKSSVADTKVQYIIKGVEG